MLKYAAISFMLFTVNKLRYNDSLNLHEYTKMIGLKRKRHLFGAKKLKLFLLFSGIDISGKCSKQNFYAFARTKKAMSLRHSAYIPSVKSPLHTLKIYRLFKILKVFSSVTCQKIFLDYIKRLHFYSKKIFCIKNKIKPVWFYSLCRNYFVWVKQWSLTCAEYVPFVF